MSHIIGHSPAGQGRTVDSYSTDHHATRTVATSRTASSATATPSRVAQL